MDEHIYFAGDPAVDSPRRHLERVLAQPQPQRRWPWIVGLLAGGGSWTLWRWLRRRRDDRFDSSGHRLIGSSAHRLIDSSIHRQPDNR